MQFSFPTFSGGWKIGVGWLEKSDIELTSAKVEVEVGAELVNKAKLSQSWR